LGKINKPITLNFTNLEHDGDEYKEESPYKPETTLLCVRSRLKNTIALIIAPKRLGKQIN
jgi:hypothetical protein